MALDDVDKVLDEVMAGRAIGENLWMEAKRTVRDLRAKLPLLEAAQAKREVALLAVGSDREGRPTYDEIAYSVCQCADLIERLIQDVRRLDRANCIRVEDADKIIALTTLAKRLGHEPARMVGVRPRLVFKEAEIGR